MPDTVIAVPGTPGVPGAKVPPLLMLVSVAATVPAPASVPPAFTVTGLFSVPLTTSVPLCTVVAPIVEVPPSVHAPLACTFSVLKLTKRLSASPDPCSTSALVAPIAVLPTASPISTEPVCSVRVLAPGPANTTEAEVPPIVPALVTAPEVPVMYTPNLAPLIVPPVWLVTVPPAPRNTPSPSVRVMPFAESVRAVVPVMEPALVTMPPLFNATTPL